MIFRALDVNGDWLFGKGKNDYSSGNKAVGLNIQTRLASFLGDCFFDKSAGIDWFNLLGSKNQLALNLAVSSIILITQDVTGILQVSINTNNVRNVTITYKVQTTFGTLSNIFQYSLNGIA